MSQKTRWRTPYTPELHDKKGEVNRLPSLTIPDQTMSIREILERHSRGLPTSGYPGVPMYDGDDPDFDSYLPDPATLDLADRQRLAELALDEVADIKTRFDKTKADAKKKKPEPAPASGPTPQPELPPNTQPADGTPQPK